MTPRLSILIATLDSRKEQFDALCDRLFKQGAGTSEVQIVASCDAGQATIGSKRQSLLEKAKGTHVIFHDDDDEPSDDYVPSILEHCRPEVDCIGFKIDCYGYVRGKPEQVERACVSHRYLKWAENMDGFRYVRHTHHLVPVRRDIALKVGFSPTSTYGEDYLYSMGLRRHLKTEAFIDKVLYTIRHNPNKAFGE